MLIKGRVPLPKPQRGILLIQLGDIGDVVLTEPTIRTLRKNFPATRIQVCVRAKARELIDCCPAADGVIAIDKFEGNPGRKLLQQLRFLRQLRRFRFDWAIELRSADRGAILSFLSGAPVRIGRYGDDKSFARNSLYTHIVSPNHEREINEYAVDHCLNILHPFGLSAVDRKPRLTVPSDLNQRVGELCRREGVPEDRPLITVHAFSLWKFKEWQMGQWARLIDHINRHHEAAVVLTGSAEERGRATQLQALCQGATYNLAGKTTIGEMAALLKRCRLFIGVDTGALHIAAAVGTPTVAIFGPSPAIMWAPRGEQHTVISKTMPCVPCRDKGCQGTERSRCLDTLTFEECGEVIDAQLGRFLA